jgi:hypothetical protein
VIGANDVVNPGGAPRQVEPDLRHADHRRRQGAPVLRDQALENPGFAGIDNELYFPTAPTCSSATPRRWWRAGQAAIPRRTPPLVVSLRGISGLFGLWLSNDPSRREGRGGQLAASFLQLGGAKHPQTAPCGADLIRLLAGYAGPR